MRFYVLNPGEGS